MDADTIQTLIDEFDDSVAEFRQKLETLLRQVEEVQYEHHGEDA